MKNSSSVPAVTPKQAPLDAYESRNFLFVSNCIALIDGGVQRSSSSQEVVERI